jgi:hypothetical protein
MKMASYLYLDVDEENNVVIQKNKMNLTYKNKYNCSSCPICLNDFTKDGQIDDLVFLRCGHEFCLSCLEADRKKSRNEVFLCPLCKNVSNDCFIVDSEENVKSYFRLKPNEMVKKGICKKCLKEIDTKYFLQCARCDLLYHGYCLKNYTNEMKNTIFLCPNCLFCDFAEEKKYVCELCKEYSTKLKQNLERHKQKTCMKYTCIHCEKNFRSKLLLKAHTEIQKLDSKNLLLDFVKNQENATLDWKLNRMQIEGEDRSSKQNAQENRKKIKKNERSLELENL